VRLAGGLVEALADDLPALDDDRPDKRVRTRMSLRHRSELNRAMEVLLVSLSGGEAAH
jgi:hypothetical protein